uniref:Glycylpeptide N-tetradecanoyltransferase n=1 Tax=Taeniopygia guttata TaxID=59729 RepID=A0A674GGY8_TAEGU
RIEDGEGGSCLLSLSMRGSAPDSPGEEPTYRPGGSAYSFCLSTLLSVIQEIQKAIELFSVGQGPAKTMEEASKRSYQFWDTQPVPKLGEVVNTHGPGGARQDNIRQEPYTLPQGFTWDLKELYTLLNENYVEDDDNMFRFDYSPEFLLWALRPPGWLPQWHCGVRVVSSKKLVGFISAIQEKKMVEINFLCVHKKLRSKRVAPVLIREITRRVHLEGIFQAVYTAGVVLPKPVGTCRYWNMTMQRTTKLYRLPEVGTPKTPGLRPMEHKDIPAVHKLLTEYLKQFHLTPVMSREEVEHWFVPQENIIDTFVVESAPGEVTDFLSFYTLPSTIMNHPTHKSLKAAYSFYNVHTKTPLIDLMSDALILAKSVSAREKFFSIVQGVLVPVQGGLLCTWGSGVLRWRKVGLILFFLLLLPYLHVLGDVGIFLLV